jgi:hypothetical protein
MVAIRRLLALSLVLVVALACSSSKKGSGSTANKTAAQFCENFGKAACNATVVSKCSGGGDNIENCVSAQADFCMNALVKPLYYSNEHAKACLDYVKKAYEDAKLTADEVKVVRELADPCDKLIEGPGDVGAVCTTIYDCNTLVDLSCVMRAGETTGTCQVAEIVGGGFSCSQPNQICDTGFYCDGQNCLARPNTEGASCSAEIPCAEDFKCLGSATSAICTAKSDTGEDCTSNLDCKSGVCSGPICVELVELTHTDPFCADLR